MAWTRAERRWRQTVLGSILPAGARHDGTAGVDLQSFGLVFDRAAPVDLRWAWRASVWLLTWLPLLTTGRPLHALAPPRRDLVLQRWSDSPNYLLRQVVVLAKTVAAWALLADPATRQRLAIRL